MITVLRRHIVVTCRRDGETVEVWIPADAGQGDKPDTAKPFVIPLPKRNAQRREVTQEELAVVERI